jgi:dCMP deaminase
LNKWINRFLSLSKEISTWSQDPSKQIGVVIVDKDNIVKSLGFNGFPRGIKDTKLRLENREDKYKYMVHGEQNAIYASSINGVSLKNTTIYVYGLPVCNECAKAIIQVGITKVICQYPNPLPDRWVESSKIAEDLFREAGVVLIKFDEKGKII